MLVNCKGGLPGSKMQDKVPGEHQVQSSTSLAPSVCTVQGPVRLLGAGCYLGNRCQIELYWKRDKKAPCVAWELLPSPVSACWANRRSMMAHHCWYLQYPGLQKLLQIAGLQFFCFAYKLLWNQLSKTADVSRLGLPHIFDFMIFFSPLKFYHFLVLTGRGQRERVNGVRTRPRHLKKFHREAKQCSVGAPDPHWMQLPGWKISRV